MNKLIDGFRSRWLRAKAQGRSEKGAGALLPIIVIGTVVIIVAASIASATSISARVGGKQVEQISNSIETISLLNSFVADINNKGPLLQSSTIAGSGSYQLYYSSAATEPTSITDVGVITMPSSGPPATAKWILANLYTTTKSSAPQLAVYSMSLGTPVFDNVINWASGTVAIANSTIGVSPGVTGKSTMYIGSNVSTQSSTLTNNQIQADLYLDYSLKADFGPSNYVTGLMSSRSIINFSGTPNGSVTNGVYSANNITGSVASPNGKFAYSSTRPLPVRQTPTSYVTTGKRVALTAANCASAAAFKAVIEATTEDTTFTNAVACNSKWPTDVNPKAKLIFSYDRNVTADTGALVINATTIRAGAGSVGFATKSLVMNGLVYDSGASGQFMAEDYIDIRNSTLTGAISSVGTTSGTFQMMSSTIRYLPVAAPVEGAPSTSISLVRVR